MALKTERPAIWVTLFPVALLAAYVTILVVPPVVEEVVKSVVSVVVKAVTGS